MKNGNKSPGGTESFFEQLQHTCVLRFSFLETGYSMQNKNARRNIEQFFEKNLTYFIQINGKWARKAMKVLNKWKSNAILVLLK